MRRATGLNALFIGAGGWRYNMCHPFLSAPPSVMEPCPRRLLLLAQTCSVPAALADGGFQFPFVGDFTRRDVLVEEGLPPLAAFARAEQCRVHLSEAEARVSGQGLLSATYGQPTSTGAEGCGEYPP